MTKPTRRRPQATTGIVLTLHGTDGRYTLTRIDQPTWEFGAAHTLDTIRARVGLTNGYWLRGTELFHPHRTTWTWVQL